MYKYSFVMAYGGCRLDQFNRTMLYLDLLYEERDDFEVVLAMDSKCGREEATTAIDNLNALYGERASVIRVQNPYPSPVPTCNAGISHAKGEYVIMTNPECCHESDVLEAFDVALEEDPDAYYTAAAKFALNPNQWIWRQHGQRCPTFLHFCSCIKRDNPLVYFDGAFSRGYCFDDDAYRDEKILAGMRIVSLDDAVVFHQSHHKGKQPKKLWLKNRDLWAAKYAEPLGIDPIRYSHEMQLPTELVKPIGEGRWEYVTSGI